MKAMNSWGFSSRVRFLLIISVRYLPWIEVLMFAQPYPRSSQQRRTLGVLFAVVLGALFLVGEVNAATYTIWLKSGPSSPYEVNGVKCATGSLVDTTGAFTLTVQKKCFPGNQPNPGSETFTGIATLNKALVKTNGDNEEVLSADGITFSGTAGTSTLALAWSSNSPNIGTRNFTYTYVQGSNTNTISGQYHLFNQAAPIPEPETLWLALAGLSALALSRRKWRRS